MDPRRRRPARTLLTLAVLCAAALGGAGTTPATEPTLGPPAEHRLVLESRYRFYVRPYDEPVVIDPASFVAPQRYPVETDELALVLLAAKVRGDVEAYLEALGEAHRESVLAAWEEQELTPEAVGRRWTERYAGVRVELRFHVYRGLEEMIRYRITRSDPDTQGTAAIAVVEEGGLAFRRDEEGWWRLVEASDDPVYRNWRFEGERKVIEQELERGAQ